MSKKRFVVMTGIWVLMIAAGMSGAKPEMSSTAVAGEGLSFYCLWRGEFVSDSLSIYLSPSVPEGRVTGTITFPNGKESGFSGKVVGRQMKFESSSGNGVVELAYGDNELRGWIDIPKSGRRKLNLKRK